MVAWSFCIDRLNRKKSNWMNWKFSQILKALKPMIICFHQSDTVAELNVNRSYDDLLDVSTTYLGTDLVQITDVFNAQLSFPMTLDCHTDGELLGGGKLDILFGHRSF